MALSNDLISQFVKVTNDKNETKKETTILYGTAIVKNGETYVRLDGSELDTPVSATADAKTGERVTVMIKNHTATITGNINSPAARVGDVANIDNKVESFGTLVGNKVDVEDLTSINATIDTLVTDNLTIWNTVNAWEADVNSITSDNVIINEKLTANQASIDSLTANKIDVVVADAKYATIANLDVANANIHNLETTYGDFASATVARLNAMDAEIDKLIVGDFTGTFANIDFSNINTAAIEKIFAGTGLIQNITVGDGIITGNLVGVTISGDLIEGNTVKADKLVVKGSDGLYYKLNTDGMTVEEQQTDQNSLNGSVIKAKSITASKVSVTDLVAFGATIGGFHISETSIYSGTKTTAANTTRGIYLDKEGQMAFGDANNFLKYYKDSDGSYKLVISASNVVFATTNKSIDTVINEAIETVSISGRNLIVRSGELVDTYVVAQGTVMDCEPSYKSATMLNAIKVEPGQIYAFSKDVSASDLYFRFVWYDSEMNALGREANNASEFTWTAPSNAVYIRVSYPYINGGNPKLEKGPIATAYTPAIEDFAETIKTTETNLNNAISETNEELHGAIDDLDIGGTNLIQNSDFKYGTDKWVYVGITVTVESDDTYDSYLKMESAEVGSSSNRIYVSTTDNFNHKPGRYSLSFYAKADAATTIQANIAGGTSKFNDFSINTEWERYTWTYDATSTGSLTFWPNEANVAVYLTKVKLETGDKTTDWTPASEDMATSGEVEKAQGTADDAVEKADEAQALIAQLSDSISMLVTDGNGSSLMTQTEEGWTFSTANIQNIINSTSEGLDTLTNDLGDVSSVVEVLKQAVDDLSVTAEYIRIGTYEDEPCIELGESDSDFKLIITNTRIMFMEGSDMPAYINNQSLNIKKAVIEEELQQGNFVWKIRSNGNLGLTWRGEA